MMTSFCFLLSGKASVVWKNVIFFNPQQLNLPLLILKVLLCIFISQIVKLINWSRTIKCQTMCIYMHVNTSFMVNLHDK